MRYRLAVLLCTVCALFAADAVYADFDVNAVAGNVTVDANPAPSGMVINITDLSRQEWVTVLIDGPDVPPFLRGQGRFDTGDVPIFDTGDEVMVNSPGLAGSARVILAGGTTFVCLDLTSPQGPEGPEGQDGGLRVRDKTTSPQEWGGGEASVSPPTRLGEVVGRAMRGACDLVDRVLNEISDAVGLFLSQATALLEAFHNTSIGAALNIGGQPPILDPFSLMLTGLALASGGLAVLLVWRETGPVTQVMAEEEEEARVPFWDPLAPQLRHGD